MRFRKYCRSENITLSQNAGTATVIGNDALMYRAIYNLVENAIKYNHDGGSVTVSVEKTAKVCKS